MNKEVIVIGLKKVEPEIQGKIVEFFNKEDTVGTQREIVFLDDEMYNVNLSAIYAKILKIKGKFDVEKFKSDPENIKNAEIWRSNFEERKVTLFRTKDLVINFNLKYKEAKTLLIQLELFGLVVEDKESGEGWYKFIPNDAARLFHLSEVLAKKVRDYSVLEEEFLSLKKRLTEVEKKTLEDEKQKVIDGYLGKTKMEIVPRELEEDEILESVPVEEINKNITEESLKGCPLHIVEDEADLEDEEEQNEQNKSYNPITDSKTPVLEDNEAIPEEEKIQGEDYKQSLKDSAKDDMAEK